MSRHRTMTVEQSWADRLGIDSTDSVGDELPARFEQLSRFVLTGHLPPAGKSSAEAATGTGTCGCWPGFLAAARRLMCGQEGRS